MQQKAALLILALSCSLVCVNCLRKDELFPFGNAEGDKYLEAADDAATDNIQLPTSFFFNDQGLEYITINTNGIITFGVPLEQFREDLVIPFSFQYIAPFYADIDTRSSGSIFYRETQDPSLLHKASSYISQAFPYQQFNALWLYIITWDGVGYYNSGSDKINTFQTILASDGGGKSFVFFLYPESGIQWTIAEGKEGRESVIAQVGIDTGLSEQYFLLSGKENNQLDTLDRTSNTGEPGLWLISVGVSSNGENKIELPGEDIQPGYKTEQQPGHEDHFAGSYDRNYPESTDQNPGHTDLSPEHPYNYPDQTGQDHEHSGQFSEHSGQFPDNYPEQPDPNLEPRVYYPEQPDHHTGYPDQYPGYPDQHPGYPDQHPGQPDQHPGYPDQQPGYPDQHPGYPDQQPGYPDQHPGYPDQHPGYTDQQPGPPDQHPGYPDQQPGYPDQHPGYPDQHPGYTDQYPGYPDQHPGYPDQHPEQPDQHSGYPDQYPGYPDQHPGQPDQHPGYPDQHPGYPDQHLRDPDQHPGQPDQHPGYPDQYPGYPDQHPGQPDQHPGYPDQHPGYPDQYPGYPDQHPGQPDLHPGYPDQHPGYPDQYPGYTDQHPGQPDQHPGYPDQHSGYPDQYPGYTDQHLGQPGQLPEYPDQHPGQPDQHSGYPDQYPGYTDPHHEIPNNYPDLLDASESYPHQPEARIEPPSHPTCLNEGVYVCQVGADCTDYDYGYCCSCKPFHIGNGYDCIALADLTGNTANSQPKIRVVGTIRGSINGQSLDKVKFVIVSHLVQGKQFINFSPVNKNTKILVQKLFSLSSIYGFLFGVPTKDSIDIYGFNLVGGNFETTSTIQFSDSRHFLTVKQSFTGISNSKDLNCELEINGEAPDFSLPTNAVIKPNEIEYKSIEPGVLKSRFTQSLLSGSVPLIATVEDTIVYKECQHNNFDSRFSQFKVLLTKIAVVSMANSVRITFIGHSFSRYARENPCKTAICHGHASCEPEGDSYRCVCHEGYEGDGWNCFEVDKCMNHDCDVNANCVSTVGSYQCSCREGFSGDGKHCEPVQQQVQSCREHYNCHEYAECQFNEYYNQYQCVCRHGFRGDGYYCEYEGHQQPEYDCSANPGICHQDARCSQDYQQQRYTCQCLPDFDGDGRTCVRKNCHTHPEICHRDAHCIRQGYDFVCVCNPGFHGDGVHACSYIGGTDPTTSGADEKLVYTQGMYLGEVSSKQHNKQEGKFITFTPGQLAVAVDTHCSNHDIYWTDASLRCIKSSKADGSQARTVVDQLVSPEGIAIDWIADNMYWTDSGTDKIQVSRLDGSNIKTLFSQNITNPRAIAVDPIRGLLFWSDWSRTFPRIERSNLDGTERRILVTENLGLPNGLALDLDSKSVCWSDAGMKKIECSTYEGRNRRVVYHNEDMGYMYGLAYHSNLFYWTDWQRANVVRNIGRHSSILNEDISIPGGSSGKLYGLTVARSSCPQGSNPCSYKDGGCRYLCFASLTGGRTCACPDSVKPEECEQYSHNK